MGNVAAGVQVEEASKLQIHEPRATKAKVMFRFRPSEVLILVAPTNEDGPNLYAIKYEGGSQTPIIRGLKQLFVDNRIELDPKVIYEVDTEVMEDRNLGFCVGASWTSAKVREKTTAEKDVAAGERKADG